MQDIYQQRNNWKIILAIIGIIVLIVTLIYSNFLAKSLEKNEEINSNLFVESLKFLAQDKNLNSDAGLQTFVVENFTLPVIIKGDDGLLEGYNFPQDKNTDQAFLKQKIAQYLASGKEAIKSEGYNSEIYCFNSNLLNYIKYYPLVQIFLVGSFIGLGYFLFNSSKKAEQNRVWAGMAKETAHQLGTPISAIMAWVMHLKENTDVKEDQLEVLDELEKDVDRLNLVADRFSKIGSKPELSKLNLIDQLLEAKEYMQRRSPKRVVFDFPNAEDKPKFANINSHLLAWVLENLLRNALDAMDSEGKIKATVTTEEDFHCIDIKDTGNGIPATSFKKVFQPGYSTKQRGWGLGLSLAKRIIEEYHNGKIFVKSSKINEGTTFTIKLKRID